MAALTTQTLSDAGTNVTFTVATASDTAEVGNGGNTFAICRNTTGSAVTFTFNVPGNTFWGAATQDNAVSVPATTGVRYVPLRKAYDDGTGRATITTSSQAAGIDIAIVRMS